MSNLAQRTHWIDLANGAWWELTPGVDHEQPARGALQAARMWALSRGLKVQARLPKPGAPFHTVWQIRFVQREAASSGSTAT